MRRGWIEERAGKGGATLRARYWVDGPDGEPVARSASFRVADYPGKREAKAAAERHLAAVLTDQARGSFVAPSEMTVGELVTAYVDGKRGVVSPARVHNLRKAAVHVPPDLAARPVQGLTALHLQGMAGRLRRGGVGEATIAHTHQLVKAALARAVEWGILVRSPMRGVETPAYRPAAKVPWTAEEAGRFLEETAGHRFAALWRLALLTGMRSGELRALRWSDVDLGAAQLRVERTVTVDEGGRVRMGSAPKTENSRRLVPVPVSCVAALEEQRDRVRAERAAAPTWSIADGDLVFPGAGGTLLHQPKVGAALAAEIARLGLPPLSLHGLRHTCVTILMLQGAHPKAVADLIGDRVETVMKTYAHVTVDHRRAAVDDLEAALTAAPARHKHTTT